MSVIKIINTYSQDSNENPPSILALVPNKEFNLKNAAITATQDFLNTLSGFNEFKQNNNDFNWIDFIQKIPEKFCKKHKFTLLDNNKPNQYTIEGIFIDSEVNVDECIAEPDIIDFKEIISELPDNKNDALTSGIINNINGYWTENDIIFCETEEDANSLINWLSEYCTECLVNENIAVKALINNNWSIYTINYDIETIE